MVRTITFIIDGDVANVALAACALRGACSLSAICQERLDELELAVVEAINNIIEHGFEDRPCLPIRIVTELQPDQITVRLADSGKSIPAELLDQARHTGFSAEIDDLNKLPEGGMGLRLIMQSVDQVAYTASDDNNELLLVKMIAPVDDLGRSDQPVP